MRKKIGPQVRHATCEWRDVQVAAAACEERFKVKVSVEINVWLQEPREGDLLLKAIARDTLWPNEDATLATVQRQHWPRGKRSLEGNCLVLITDLYKTLEGLTSEHSKLPEDRPSSLHVSCSQVS